MQPYYIILPNEKEKFYHRLAGFVFLLNGLLLGYSFFSPAISSLNKSAGVTSLLLIVVAISLFFFKPSHSYRQYITLLAFFTSVIYWALIGFWWIGLIMIALIMLYYISVRRMVVTVSQEQILYPTWPERKIKWTELSNLVLKDSLLTIDFKTDKIIQQMIDEKRTSINETEFNEFCRQQLNK